MFKLKNIFNLAPFVILIAIISCSSLGSLESRNKKFLTEGLSTDEEEIRETFRVLITSNKYVVSQTKYKDYIRREKDPGGDSYICDEIKKYDKINEEREGMIKIWLFPDRGTLMKVRPHKPIFLVEIDELITEDIQRWSFKFPKWTIHPNQMFIKYRVVLRKKQSDNEIIKEVQKKMLGEE